MLEEMVDAHTAVYRTKRIHPRKTMVDWVGGYRVRVSYIRIVHSSVSSTTLYNTTLARNIIPV